MFHSVLILWVTSDSHWSLFILCLPFFCDHQSENRSVCLLVQIPRLFCSPRTGFQACLRILPLAVLSEALLWVSSIRSWWSWLKNLEHVVHKNHSAYCSDSHYFCYLFCAAICSLGVVSKITHHSYFLGSLWFLLRNFCQCWQWWFLNLQLHVLCGCLDKINQQS